MGGAPAADRRVVLDDVLLPTASAPEHVIGFLWDGCNPNVLYDAVANGERRTSRV